jgi:hypothetical protein
LPQARRYRSDARNDPPYFRKFVVQFGPATDVAAGRQEGRVDHLASTRSARFRSLDELLAAVADLLAEVTWPGHRRNLASTHLEKIPDSLSHLPGPPLVGVRCAAVTRVTSY